MFLFSFREIKEIFLVSMLVYIFYIKIYIKIKCLYVNIASVCMFVSGHVH